MVNADWLITLQAKQTLDYVNKGAVDGLLNECIRRYFFSISSQRAKEAKIIIMITPDLRLALYLKHNMYSH